MNYPSPYPSPPRGEGNDKTSVRKTQFMPVSSIHHPVAQIQHLLDPLQKLKRKTLRALFRYDPSYTDMFLDKSELYFSRLYLHQMDPYLSQLEQGMKVLDAGCQAGRFTVALGKMGFCVQGE